MSRGRVCSGSASFVPASLLGPCRGLEGKKRFGQPSANQERSFHEAFSVGADQEPIRIERAEWRPEMDRMMESSGRFWKAMESDFSFQKALSTFVSFSKTYRYSAEAEALIPWRAEDQGLLKH